MFTEKMEVSLAGYIAIALSGVTLAIGWLVQWVYRWNKPTCSGILPPGSMGFPVIGETFQFFKANSSLDIPDYFKLRMRRYGNVFKTSLFGQPAVFSCDAEVSRYILKEEGHLFELGYPVALRKIFGEKGIDAFNGATHKFIRRICFTLFGLQNLKEVLLPELERAIRDCLMTWAAKPSVEVHGSAPDILFGLVTKKFLSFEATKSAELRKSIDVLSKGLLSFPIYFPGTAFYRSMQAWKNVRKTIRDTLAERLGTPDKKHGDLLDMIVEHLHCDEPLINEDVAVDVVSALLFASIYTLSATMGMAFKSLHDNPEVVQALKDETKRSTLLKNFMPFGAGARVCPGAEYSKTVVTLLLHVLVTGYKWEEIKGVDVFRSTDVMIPNGYHIRIQPIK
ncbi:unnamed protein product [Alopecurus aequalis]